MRGGEPLKREPHEPPPCFRCPKIPHGEQPTPEVGRQSELTTKNDDALRHYLRCKATGRFPHDSVVERNAGVIRMVEDSVQRDSTLDGVLLGLTFLGRGK